MAHMAAAEALEKAKLAAKKARTDLAEAYEQAHTTSAMWRRATMAEALAKKAKRCITYSSMGW